MSARPAAGVTAFVGLAPAALRAHLGELESWSPPAWRPIRGAVRAWAGAATDRRYRSDFMLRVAIDTWAAREVRRRRPRVVIAASLAARQTFAAARDIGATTVLLLDLPLLRAMHRDLDRAAQVWPARDFLRRFRAPAWAIARQDAERVLADQILVRGAYAEAVCRADGIADAKLVRLPSPAPIRHASPHPPTRRLRLAGLAAARHGIDTALAVARQLGVELVVRIADGSEPADLARRPGVIVDGTALAGDGTALPFGSAAGRGSPAVDGTALPVDAIICPAICETHLAELHATGLPVIASPMASLDGTGPDPYDARAFAEAVRASILAPG